MSDANKPLPAYNLSDLVILIAEKHTTMRTIIREVLHKFGVRHIHEVSTPEDGFEQFCNVNPDIVFIDWGPEFDGILFLEKIRQDKESPNKTVPVVMVTPFTEQSKVYKARDSGMTEFLAQPVSAKTIYGHICRIIDNPREFINIETYTGPDRRWHPDEVMEGGRRKTDRESAPGDESTPTPSGDEKDS